MQGATRRYVQCTKATTKASFRGPDHQQGSFRPGWQVQDVAVANLGNAEGQLQEGKGRYLPGVKENPEVDGLEVAGGAALKDAKEGEPAPWHAN